MDAAELREAIAGSHARYLLDIWPTYQGASHGPRLRDAKRRLGRRPWACGL